MCYLQANQNRPSEIIAIYRFFIILDWFDWDNDFSPQTIRMTAKYFSMFWKLFAFTYSWKNVFFYLIFIKNFI